jgi:RNA polymerase sigma-70 factor, ECF subfamily
MQDAIPITDLNVEAAGMLAGSRTVKQSSTVSRAVAEDEAQSDEELMTAFADGRVEAFTRLFQRYKQPLFGFFRRRVAQPALAEELAQETFIAILRAAPRYQVSATFRTWIYAIAFRILQAHRRKAAFRATFFGSQTEAREPASTGRVDVDVMMRQAVGRLDAIDREVLLLREFEQLSYAEIAELLNVPLNAVRARLFKARTALHDVLATPANTNKERI